MYVCSAEGVSGENEKDSGAGVRCVMDGQEFVISRCIYAETRESGRDSGVLADGESSTVSACVCARRVSRPIDAR
jgi:hypothetical protein